MVLIHIKFSTVFIQGNRNSFVKRKTNIDDISTTPREASRIGNQVRGKSKNR